MTLRESVNYVDGMSADTSPDPGPGAMVDGDTDALTEVARLAERVRRAEADRDRAIRAARGARVSLRKLAEATGLSHQTIANIERSA